MSSPARPRLCFCLAYPEGFSGQKAATLLVRDGLARRGWSVHTLPQPVLARGEGGRAARLGRYARDLLTAWGRAVRELGPGDVLHLSLGQTKAAFLRDGIPLLLAAARGQPILIALNGGLFMRWSAGSTEARWFRSWCRLADHVVVVGEHQRRRLAGWVGADRVVLIANTGEPGLARTSRDPAGAVRVLFLSSLIDTKGYPQVLEAAATLAEQDVVAIDLTVCGRHLSSDHARTLNAADQAAAWIRAAVDRISRTARGRAQWIEGATGHAKAELFAAADIFILPTDYAVEAQPLVLLEAMAAGCAIITSRAGEIETLLDETTAVLLDDVSPGAVTAALAALAADPRRREALGAAARQRFETRFALERHLDGWEVLLREIAVSPTVMI